jgi:type I restriction enzyme S subunit
MAGVEKLITEHIDVWTSAIKKRNATGRGSNKKIELTGIKKLRELILELAVRGKLVPQDASDEPASVLLEKIAEEKAQLIADKKIKKQKPLPAITDDEKPFNIPQNWLFQRFGEVMFNRDGERKPVSADERRGIQGQYNYYGASGVIDQVNDFLFDKSLLLIGEDGANLISRSTPIAFLAHGKYWVNNHAHVLDGITTQFLEFIALHINAISLEDYITGTAQPKMNQAKMNSIVIAIPPEAEQHRIVAKVDELMALCDQLEQQTEQSLTAHQTLVEVLLASLTSDTSTEGDNKANFQTSWQRIAEHFDVLFTTEASIEQLKQTILQLAVMGKLVPQNPNDEPASLLLEKIAEEKAQLITDKKIKKQKPLPEITDEEKPFEPPSGWTEARFGEVYLMEYGDNLPKPKRSDTGEYKVYGSNGVVGSHNQSSVQDPCIVIGRKGSAGALNLSQDEGCWVTDVAYSVTPPNGVDLDFAFKQFHTLGLATLGKGIKPGLNRNEANLVVIFMPPLAEQHRIVAKVDELMALCEQLKTRLSDAQTTQLYLADAVVSNALGQQVINSEKKVEIKTMKITTTLSNNEFFLKQTDGVLALLIENEGGAADAKAIWNKSSFDLPSFYKQLKKEIKAGYINPPAKAVFE